MSERKRARVEDEEEKKKRRIRCEYYADDARMWAVSGAGLDLGRTWSGQEHAAVRRALERWHERCREWWDGHCDIPALKDTWDEDRSRELGLAFAHLRRKEPCPRCRGWATAMKKKE